MKDFLDFLNTATQAELEALPGVTSEQIQSVLAARPFSTLEEAAQTKDFSAKKVAALQAAYAQLTRPETEIEPTKKPEPKITESMSPSKGNRVWRLIVRILVALVILGALFAAVYFGIPLFKEKILNPLQNNTTRVSEVASQQAADVAQLSSQIATLQSRADAVDEALKTNNASLTALQAMQTQLQTNLDSQKSDTLAQLDQQIALTRAIELLSRSRLYLSESNYGLAQTDAAAARTLLYGLLPTIPADQASGLKVVINRLDLALSNLPAYPVVAVYDIDSAWQLLIDGLPNVPQLALTPSISSTLPPTAAIPTPESTPTP